MNHPLLVVIICIYFGIEALTSIACVGKTLDRTPAWAVFAVLTWAALGVAFIYVAGGFA